MAQKIAFWSIPFRAPRGTDDVLFPAGRWLLTNKEWNYIRSCAHPIAKVVRHRRMQVLRLSWLSMESTCRKTSQAGKRSVVYDMASFSSFGLGAISATTTEGQPHIPYTFLIAQNPLFPMVWWVCHDSFCALRNWWKCVFAPKEPFSPVIY